MRAKSARSSRQRARASLRSFILYTRARKPPTQAFLPRGGRKVEVLCVQGIAGPRWRSGSAAAGKPNMSMEAYVLCSHPIGSLEEWQGAIDALGFGLRFRAGGGLSGHAGHLPAVWRGQEAGFELYSCSSEDVAELSEDLDLDLGGPWPFGYAFRYGGISGCVGTWFAVAACLQLTGGIAVDGRGRKNPQARGGNPLRLGNGSQHDAAGTGYGWRRPRLTAALGRRRWAGSSSRCILRRHPHPHPHPPHSIRQVRLHQHGFGLELRRVPGLRRKVEHAAGAECRTALFGLEPRRSRKAPARTARARGCAAGPRCLRGRRSARGRRSRPGSCAWRRRWRRRSRRARPRREGVRSWRPPLPA